MTSSCREDVKLKNELKDKLSAGQPIEIERPATRLRVDQDRTPGGSSVAKALKSTSSKRCGSV